MLENKKEKNTELLNELQDIDLNLDDMLDDTIDVSDILEKELKSLGVNVDEVTLPKEELKNTKRESIITKDALKEKHNLEMIWKTELLTIEDVCKNYGLTELAIRAEMNNNRYFPKTTKIGELEYFSKVDFDSYITGHEDTEIIDKEKNVQELEKEILAYHLLDAKLTRRILAKLDGKFFHDFAYILYDLISYNPTIAQKFDSKMVMSLMNYRGEKYFSIRNVDTTLYASESNSLSLLTKDVIIYLEEVTKIKNKLTKPTIENMEFLTQEVDMKIEMLLLEYKRNRLAQLIENSTKAVRGTIRLGKERFSGVEGAITYLTEGMSKLKSEGTLSQGKTYVDGLEIFNKQKELEEKGQGAFELLFPFGKEFPNLSKVFGEGVRRSKMYVTLAPAKTGKTKWNLNLVYKCICAGHSALIWAVEGGKDKALAEIRARHYFEKTKHRTKTLKGKELLTAQDIMDNTHLYQTVKEEENKYALELLTSSRYGTLHFVTEDTPFLLENFEQVIRDKVSNHPDIALVFVDYITLIKTERRGQQNPVAIKGEAVQRSLTLAKELKVAFLTPAQFKQESIKAMIKKGEGEDFDEVLISGGETSEIIRTPDVIWVLYSNLKDKEMGQLRMLKSPSRDYNLTEDILMVSYLGVDYFSEVNKTSSFAKEVSLQQERL